MGKGRMHVWGTAVLVLLAGCSGGKEEQSSQGTPLHGTATPGGQLHRAGKVPESGPRLLRLATPAPSSPPSTKDAMLQKMGIEVGGGRITIDTRRARSYFEKLERQISSGMDRGVQRAKAHAAGADDIGIYVGKERVEIDLNKTKNFLKVWGESMRILGEELDRSLKNSP